jgi:SAM-dependent methyltransferase
MGQSITTRSTEKDLLSRRALRCIGCGQESADVFFEMKDVPVLSNAPCSTREDALRFPTGQIQLAFCPRCGHVFNTAFRPEIMIYDSRYENSLHYSAHFDQYIRELAQQLVANHQLFQKDVIELGCGNGDFLGLLCQLGGNRGVGFDPSHDPDRLSPLAAENVRVVRDRYNEDYGHLACDLLCSRHVLEHIPEPCIFLSSIRRAIGNRNTRIFFETPNALYSLRHKGIWDIIYEHVSYFWSLSLSRLFLRSGFSPQAVWETYGNQFLCMEALPAEFPPAMPILEPDQQEELQHVADEARQFAECFCSTVRKATSVLEDAQHAGQRVLLWGAGSKGVTFLNLFKDVDCLQYAVDINPHKQGKYIAGSGHLVISPEQVKYHNPDIVLVMNPLYQKEIGTHLSELGVTPRLVAI